MSSTLLSLFHGDLTVVCSKRWCQYCSFNVSYSALVASSSVLFQFVDSQTKQRLIEAYYSLDGGLCREILGKKLSSRLRKELVIFFSLCKPCLLGRQRLSIPSVPKINLWGFLSKEVLVENVYRINYALIDLLSHKSCWWNEPSSDKKSIKCRLTIIPMSLARFFARIAFRTCLGRPLSREAA